MHTFVSLKFCLQASKPRHTRDAAPSIEKTPAQPPAAKAASAGNSRSENCSALDAQQELHLQTWEGRLEKWKAALDKKAAQIEDSKAAAVAISKANEAEQAVCQTHKWTVPFDRLAKCCMKYSIAFCCMFIP